MSNNDSFIEEVTEEVRRDRLFALMRRYGWIAILAVVLLVGGAAYNEWRKARDAAAAEALGDAILSALDQPDSAARVAALQEINVSGDARIAKNMILANEAGAGGDSKTAVAALQTLAQDESLPQIDRDLAQLKILMLEDASVDKATRQAMLEKLAIPGAPFRLLAEELQAAMLIKDGDKTAAIAKLQDVFSDSEASNGMRQRVSQLIVALGGQLEAS